MHALEGFGGAQIWRTDGTFKGTVRAFDRSENDLYIDRPSLDADYPARMGVYRSGLYIPANYGLHDRLFPRGGFEWGSDPAAYQINQAVVISDVDTHPTDSNVTVTLKVDKGLIVLGEQTNLGDNSPQSYHFLVAESRLTDRVLLMNTLQAQGHTVDTVLDGVSAYQQVLAREEAAARSTGSNAIRQYDCVLMAMNFAGGSTQWDGLQTIRLIREWEDNMNEAASASAAAIAAAAAAAESTNANETYTSTSSSASSASTGASSPHTRVPIVAMSKLRDLINDANEAYAAGADLFLTQTVTDYVATDEAEYKVEQPQGTFTTARMEEKASMRSDYDEFAHVVLRFLARSSTDVNITSVIEVGQTIPDDLIGGLAGLTVGHTITIQGSLRQVNHVLTSVFYYAPNDTNGNISFAVTVTDQPSTCMLPTLPAANPNVVVQPSTYPLLPLPGFNQSSSARNENLTAHLCDAVGPTSITKYIPLFVSAVNQAPEVLLSDESFSSVLDVEIVVPTVTVVDVDHDEVSLLSSFGEPIEAPVSVTVSALGGRISFPLIESGLAVYQGIGRLDRIVTIRGALNLANNALAKMRYVCRTSDGCFAGYSDVLTILANDEGYTGKGGALTYTIEVPIQITDSSGAFLVVDDAAIA